MAQIQVRNQARQQYKCWVQPINMSATAIRELLQGDILFDQLQFQVTCVSYHMLQLYVEC